MNGMKMSVLPKPAHRFNTDFIKSSVVFKEIEKITFLWKKRDSRELKNNSEQKNSAESVSNLI